MTRIDTVKISFPLALVTDYKPTMYDLQETKDGNTGEAKRHTQVLKKEVKIPGLNDVYIDSLGDLCTVRMSAKILTHNYLESINKDTVEQAINVINNTGCIRVHPQDVINKARVLSVDVTDNLTLSAPMADIFHALDMVGVSASGKYIVSRNKTVKNEGVTFTERVKKDATRLTAYHKGKDMRKADNKYFLRALGNKAHSMIALCDSIVRVETRHTSFSSMRDAFTINKDTPITLPLLLSSENKVNHKTFTGIINPQLYLLKVLEDFNDQKLMDVIDSLGMEAIIKHCNYDMRAIGAFCKHFSRGTVQQFPTRLRNKFEEVLARLQKRDAKTNAVIDEFIQALKTAA
jgi:hypothetical protein